MTVDCVFFETLFTPVHRHCLIAANYSSWGEEFTIGKGFYHWFFGLIRIPPFQYLQQRAQSRKHIFSPFCSWEVDSTWYALLQPFLIIQVSRHRIYIFLLYLRMYKNKRTRPKSEEIVSTLLKLLVFPLPLALKLKCFIHEKSFPDASGSISVWKERKKETPLLIFDLLISTHCENKSHLSKIPC